MGVLKTLNGTVMVLVLIMANTGYQTHASTTALYDATHRGDKAKVRQLLAEECTDVNMATDKLKNTPLQAAAKLNHTEIIMLLLACNANPNVQNSGQWTPIMAATRYGTVKEVFALLSADVDLDMQQEHGWTALMHAARYGYLDKTKLLLAAGANADIQNNEGWSALMLASSYKHVSIMDDLLRNGANMDLKNKHGQTAMDMARKAGSIDILKKMKHTTNNTPECTSGENLPEAKTAKKIVTTQTLSLPIFIIILGVVNAILVVSMIGLCVYFHYKLGTLKQPVGKTAVVFNNEQNGKTACI